jgi:hypothetical protein
MGFGSRNCGHCSGIGTIRKSISNNFLTCACDVCGRSYMLSLLKIKKKIIYLDQNFFSNAYKRKPAATAFLERFERLCSLAKKQLLICPYSDIHDEETHLYKLGDELFNFIKTTSRGKRFNLCQKIEEQQVINAYVAYLKNKQRAELHLSDAIEPSIHNWDESFWVDINWSIANYLGLSSIKQDKERIAKAIIDELPKWRVSCSSFENDYNLEIRDHKILVSHNYSIMDILINLVKLGGNTIEERFRNVSAFFLSECFSSIPYVNISSGLWAFIKEEIKQKRFLTALTKNMIGEVQGLSNDISHLSVFAPYCDAVFTEKRMAKLLRKWQQHPLAELNCEIFSADNWEAFDNYLDKIENSCTAEMKDELEVVYGG